MAEEALNSTARPGLDTNTPDGSNFNQNVKYIAKDIAINVAVPAILF